LSLVLIFVFEFLSYIKEPKDDLLQIGVRKWRLGSNIFRLVSSRMLYIII